MWDVHGQHLVWYSTETGQKTCMTAFNREKASSWDGKVIEGAQGEDYAGVYMLYPNTIVTANPSSFSISRLVPVTPDVSAI